MNIDEETNQITNACQAAKRFGNIWDCQECHHNQKTYAIFLTTGYEYFAHTPVYNDGLVETNNNLRKVLQFAQDNNLAYVIMARNAAHTAPEPHNGDICVASLITSLCKPERVSFIDYLIISYADHRTNYFSLRESGMII